MTRALPGMGQIHGTPFAHGEEAVSRLPRARDGAQSILDNLSVAMILVTEERRILHANRAAELVLQRRDGLVFQNGALDCSGTPALQRLAALVQSAVRAGSAGALTLERQGGASPYLLCISLLETGSLRAALVAFSDPDARDQTLALRLRGLFGLTAAEADLAVHLSCGESLAAIAARRNVLPGTVRFQIKSVAAKMHCRRQAEIVSIVANLPKLGTPTA